MTARGFHLDRPLRPARPPAAARVRALLAALLMLSLLSACGPGNHPPVPSFTATPTTGGSPLRVALDAGASADPDGTIVGYAWKADTGETASGKIASLSFTNVGAAAETHRITLTVTDDRGASASSDPTTVTVAANQPPSASFAVAPSAGTVPLHVTVDASASADPDGTIVGYAWSTDTGQSATGVSASFDFAASGAHTISLTVTDDDGATDGATAAVSALAAGSAPFRIDLVYADPSAFSASEVQVFQDAATRWSQVIVGDLTDVNLPALAPNACGVGMPALASTRVDDVLIQVQLTPIDGPGQVLARAGPCFYRSGTTLTIYGVMSFDSEDAANLAAQNRLYPTVLHEMGHVLGLGTFWDDAGLSQWAPATGCRDGTFTTSPHYTGAAGNTAFHALGGAGDAAIENDGGPGTRCGHWDEGAFDGELMTGWIEGSGKAMPLSALTVGSLQDLGYAVDAAAADGYSIPTCSPNCLTSASLDLALGERFVVPRPLRP
jgi:chitodextrinase